MSESLSTLSESKRIATHCLVSSRAFINPWWTSTSITTHCYTLNFLHQHPKLNECTLGNPIWPSRSLTFSQGRPMEGPPGANIRDRTWVTGLRAVSRSHSDSVTTSPSYTSVDLPKKNTNSCTKSTKLSKILQNFPQHSNIDQNYLHKPWHVWFVYGDHQANLVSWRCACCQWMTDHIARDSRARSCSPSLIVSSSLVIGNHSESNDNDTFPALYSILFNTQLSPTCSQHSQQWPSGLPFTYSSLPQRPQPAKTKPQPPMHLYPLIHLLIYSLLIIRYKSISRVSRLKLFYVWLNL